MASSRKRRSADPLAYPLDKAVALSLASDVKQGETVTVGLSGGIDSVVLLDALRRAARAAGIGVRALHVNHGLSANASAWQRFCAEHCRRRGVAFQAVGVHVAGCGSNVEAEARSARYRAFSTHGSEVVALAHNRDDQAETVLLHLLRGSGVRGLAAMPPVRRLEAHGEGGNRGRAQRLIRPLLQVSRREIQAHATKRRLRWIDDESNSDERFARNYLRMSVLPLLESRFEGSHENLARAAGHLQDAAGLLDEFGRLDCAAVSRDSRMDVAGLMAMGPARALNALRVYLTARGEQPLSTVRAHELLRQLGTPRRDARPEVELAHGVLSRYRGWIEWRPRVHVDNDIRCQVWRGEARIDFGESGEVIATRTRGDGICAARLQQAEVTIRRRRGGERMRLDPDRPTRTLKNLLQEAGIPPWQRNLMPLLFCGEQLVWAPLVGVAVEFQAGGRDPAWRFDWQAVGDVGVAP